MTPPTFRTFALAAALGLCATSVFAADHLELKKGDHIAIVGSGLADRQQHLGSLETLIHKAFPTLELKVRNLGFAADEVNVHPRSDEVPTTEYFLGMKAGDTPMKVTAKPDSNSKGVADVIYKAGTDFHASVILAYWGFNESFKGEAGLPTFKSALDAYIKEHLAADYGAGHPQLALLSPIAHEDLHDPNLPNGAANNRNLELYTATMAEVAKANDIPFVDLFHSSLALYQKATKPLTINGIHLNAEGDKQLAPIQFTGLFATGTPSLDDPTIEPLRAAILEKNEQWHHRYRTVDQFNIFGGRSRIKYEGVDNATILGEELAQRDVKTANRDKVVWAAAQGRKVAAVDDNLPPVDLTPPNRKESVPYLEGKEALPFLTVPQGAKLDFVASEKEFPDLINPVQMNFDTRGRLWVAVWPTYPESRPTTTNFDKLLVFDIDPKTGAFTKCTTFADGLNCPTGFQFYKDGVLLMQSPDMLFLRDTDGDGKADTKERIVHGLDAADSHHETNSICYEPGGAVYFSDGIFHRSNVETLNGPVRNTNGAIYRYEPRTNRFDRHVPYGFANPHGRVFDYWGNDIITDATGNASYFGPAFSGHLDSGAHPGMEQFWARPSRPCAGTNLLSSRHFPEDWQGQFLDCNVISFQGIFRAKVTEEGSGLKGETIEPLLSCDIAKDPNFRPSGVAVAPDGSLYMMDWSQMLIGHLQHHLRDPNRDHQHGRIYRITYPSRPLLQPAPIAGAPIPALLELLKEHEDNVRLRAKIELDTRDSKEVVAAVQKWENDLPKNDPAYEHHRLEALWVHQWHNVVNLPLLQDVLKSPEPRARAQAIRVLGYWQDRVPNALALVKTAAADESPRVRLEAVRVASFFPGGQAKEAFLAACEALSKPTDYYIDYTFKETARQLQSFAQETFLPTNPNALAYILNRMSDGDLAKASPIEPVLVEMLERKSVDLGAREKAIGNLAKLHQTSREAEIMTSLQRLDARGAEGAGGADELGKLLTATTPAVLGKDRAALTSLAEGARSPNVRRAAWVAIILADGNATTSWQSAKTSAAQQAVLDALKLLPDPAARAKFQPMLAAALADATTDTATRVAALRALPLTGAENAKANFALLATALTKDRDRTAAARALLQLPRESWSADPVATEAILAWAKMVPANDRTKQDFVETVQAGNELAALLPPADAARIRKELRGLGVSVFVVKTVREQMRYDTTRIVVEAGKPFEVIFENVDGMPHNIVFVEPGTRQSVAESVQTMQPTQKDKKGRAYVPEKGDRRILEASKLLEPDQKETLKLTAPKGEGEYEYVCTFPGHWPIMWGKLIVTKDVDAYLQAHPQPDSTPVAVVDHSAHVHH